MKRVIPITEQFQYFLQEVNENFWGRAVPANGVGVEETFGGAVLEGTGPPLRGEGLRAGGRTGISQRVL